MEVLEYVKKAKSIRVIVIEGSGKSFCSGDDMKSMGPKGVKFSALEAVSYTHLTLPTSDLV